jgi:hypothetical protein
MMDGDVTPLPQTKPAKHGWHGDEPPTPTSPTEHAEPALDTEPVPQPKPGVALQ